MQIFHFFFLFYSSQQSGDVLGPFHFACALLNTLFVHFAQISLYCVVNVFNGIVLDLEFADTRVVKFEIGVQLLLLLTGLQPGLFAVLGPVVLGQGLDRLIRSLEI